MVSLGLIGGSRRASRIFERNARVYRSRKVVLLSGLAEPLFYLGSVGLGFGHLIGSVHVGGRSVGYLDFVAPALLATSAMNGAIYDSTFNVFFKMKYARVYDAVLATPVRAVDVAVGEVAWSLTRGLLYATSFLVVMAALGLVHSPWALLALPASVLVGLGFAGVGIAATCFMRSWQDFDYVLMATLPLFLFSATFYPLTAYSSVLRTVVRCTPLYNGVALLRSLVDGGVGWTTLGHAAYLLAIGTAGVAVAARRLERRLLA
jgi:lipooligosaccharide transport system permease protein